MTVRIIPRLDIKGPNVVKGIHLEGLRVVGKPQAFARYYYEHGADELFYMDAVASLYGRNHLGDAIRNTISEVFIPLTVGGGLRTVDDIRQVLRAGADKVAINTAAINRPAFIGEAAKAFGSSTVIVVIEAIPQPDGSYECFTDCGREATGVDAVAWAVEAAERGAGELCVTAVHREGTGKGLDVELIRRISDAVDLPIIAHGGVGTPAHAAEGLRDGRVSAVAIASMLHYHAVSEIEWDEGEFGDEGNIDFIRKRGKAGMVQPIGLGALKRELGAAGIEVRHVDAD